VIADDLSNRSAVVIERLNDAEREKTIKPTTQ